MRQLVVIVPAFVVGLSCAACAGGPATDRPLYAEVYVNSEPADARVRELLTGRDLGRTPLEVVVERSRSQVTGLGPRLVLFAEREGWQSVATTVLPTGWETTAEQARRHDNRYHLRLPPAGKTADGDGGGP